MTTHIAQSKVEYRAEPMARTGQNAKAVEFLTLAGFTLHGNDWIVPLAGELAVSPDEIRNWLTGETPLTMDDAIWPKVFKALRDRREKLDAYRRMPSLRMYMIVDQRRRHVFVYRRKARGEWVREEVQGEGEISIPQLRVKLEMDDIYDDVPLLPLAVGEGEEWEDYAEEEVEDRP